MQDFSNIVYIYHPGTLGDILLSLPAFQKIREINKSSIHLCCKSTVGIFLKDMSEIEETSDIDSSFYSQLFTDSYKHLKEFVSRFKRIYCFTRDKDALSVANLRRLHGDVSIINTIPHDKIHVAAYRLKQIAGEDVYLRKRLSKNGLFLPDMRGLLKTTAERFVVIHPGSGSKHKNMPLEMFFRISDVVVNSLKAGVLFITGDAEDKDMISAIDNYVYKKGEMVHHLTNLSLIEVSSLICMSCIYIGNDSGISHLAGFLNKSAIVFFKETDPMLWATIGDDVMIIHGEFNLDEIFQLVSLRVV